jgi:plasmid stabilization system protein ParE
MSAYAIIFRQRALKEYAESTAWYEERSPQASRNFVAAVENILLSLAAFPYSFSNKYKNFYEAKTERFPFTIVYFIKERKQTIVITTLFHHKRNPANKYR